MLPLLCSLLLGLLAMFGQPVAKAACCQAAVQARTACACCEEGPAADADQAAAAEHGHSTPGCPCSLKVGKPPTHLFFAEAAVWAMPPVMWAWPVVVDDEAGALPLARGEQWSLPPPDTLVSLHCLMLC